MKYIRFVYCNNTIYTKIADEEKFRGIPEEFSFFPWIHKIKQQEAWAASCCGVYYYKDYDIIFLIVNQSHNLISLKFDLRNPDYLKNYEIEEILEEEYLAAKILES